MPSILGGRTAISLLLKEPWGDGAVDSFVGDFCWLKCFYSSHKRLFPPIIEYEFAKNYVSLVREPFFLLRI